MSSGKICSRTDAILRRFDLAGSVAPHEAPWCAETRAAAVRIAHQAIPRSRILLCGASGSGKSRLLNEIAHVLPRPAILPDDQLPDTPVIDCLHWMELEAALELLSRFGLGEVYTYLSPACLLSTGQRFRLRLAIAMGRLELAGGGILLVDEFATQLDEVSAAILARNFRRALEQSAAPVGAIVASCHNTLLMPLQPSLVVHCDFGRYAIEPGVSGGEA